MKRAEVLRAEALLLKPAEKWNLVFPRGTFSGPNLAPLGGSMTVDDAFIAEMIANWRAGGSPPLPVRKTHGHLEVREDDPARLELERSYALITDLRATPQGLEGLTEWTQAGRDAITSGDWNFWSAEWSNRHEDLRTGEMRGWWLSGCALTNDPFFNVLPRLAASTHKEQKTMDPTKYAQLKAMMKLPETATDDEVLAACDTAMKAATPPPPPPAPPADTTAAVTAAVQRAVEPLRASLTSVEKENAALKASIFEKDFDAMVKEAKAGDGIKGRALPDALVASARKLAIAEGGLAGAKALLETVELKVPQEGVGFSTKPKSTLTAEQAHAKLLSRAAELRAANPKLGHADAFKAAMAELPTETMTAHRG